MIRNSDGGSTIEETYDRFHQRPIIQSSCSNSADFVRFVKHLDPREASAELPPSSVETAYLPLSQLVLVLRSTADLLIFVMARISSQLAASVVSIHLGWLMEWSGLSWALNVVTW